jgi:ATP-dependent RNA helicase RhlB
MSNMDDAACSFRQYVAALSRLLLDFDDGEYAGATVVAPICGQFDPFASHFASPKLTFFSKYSMTDNHLSDLRFDSLDLHSTVRDGIADAGFEFCTPIQASTLPIALKQHDVAGQAQTGTGKTAAFLIAAFQRLLTSSVAPEGGDARKQPRIFILAPTRELAIQIAKDAETLGGHTGFKIGLAYGGTGYEQQRRTIEDGVDLFQAVRSRSRDSR